MNQPLRPCTRPYVSPMKISGRLVSRSLPSYIHPDLVPRCRGSAERASAEEARKIFATILHGLDDFNMDSKAHQGLLVMTNRKDVKAALATRVGAKLC